MVMVQAICENRFIFIQKNVKFLARKNQENRIWDL